MKTRCQRALSRNRLIISLFGLMASANANANALEPAPGPEPAHVDSRLQLRFLAKLSEIRYERVVEHREKLGYCVVYRGAAALGQLCVYDLGHEDLPTGVDSKEFKEALQIAEDGTLKAFSNWPHRNAQLIATGTPSIQSKGKEAKAEMRMFTSERVEGPGKARVPNMHLLLMTTGLGKFLKLNYTASNLTRDALADETDRMIQEFAQFNRSTLEKLMIDVKK